MGLYLCIFDGDDELDGVEAGSYADFGYFRNAILQELENQPGGVQAAAESGTRFPILIVHADCDGEWPAADCEKLLGELDEIGSALKRRPPLDFSADWQKAVAEATGLVPSNAYESFIDVDGEFLIARLQGLAQLAIDRQLPILFQ
ncbi:MAG: hypothetical protein JWO82_175 [Akkermansiaceae bacterium]|nr:hypothetical protein [Akkermansiaceae bacterium]